MKLTIEDIKAIQKYNSENEVITEKDWGIIERHYMTGERMNSDTAVALCELAIKGLKNEWI